MKYAHWTLIVLLILLALLMMASSVLRLARDFASGPEPINTFEVKSDNGMLRTQCNVYLTDNDNVDFR